MKLKDLLSLEDFEAVTSEDLTLTAETRTFVREAIHGLDPKQQQAIELVFFDGLTHQATAEKLGVPLGTIKGRIRNALSRLRNSLRAYQR